MWRFSSMILLCLPVAAWGLHALLAPLPAESKKAAAVAPPAVKEANTLLDDRDTLQIALNLEAAKSNERTPPKDLPGVIRYRAGELWVARDYADAFTDAGNDEGQFKKQPDAFRDNPVLMRELERIRRPAVEAAKVLPPLLKEHSRERQLVPLVRGWLGKCKEKGALLPFGTETKDKADGSLEKLDEALRAHTGNFRAVIKTRELRAEWARLIAMIESLNGALAPKRQLELLAEVRALLEPPSGRLLDSDAADVRELARAIYQPLLPQKLAPDEWVWVGNADDPPRRAQRGDVKFKAGDNSSIPLGPGGGEPDEFDLNVKDEWVKLKEQGKLEYVVKSEVGYVRIRPTAVSVARRLYQEGRAKLPRGEWSRDDLERLAKGCRDKKAIEKRFPWMKRDLEGKEYEGWQEGALDHVGPAGRNLRMLLVLAEASPGLFAAK